MNLSGEWVHVDSCEGVVGEKSMYEAGWGKSLSYVLAFTTQHVTDVTPFYTAKWNDSDFQARRRSVTSSEEAGSAILLQVNDEVGRKLTDKERDLVQYQAEFERKILMDAKMKNSWSHVYQHGRISGAHSWKAVRNETGNEDNDAMESQEVFKFQIEPFYPASDCLEIRIRPKDREIWVNGTSCAVAVEDAISIVVLDESLPGLVLQSQCFTSAARLSDFVSSLPCDRIVAMTGKLQKRDDNEHESHTKFPTLGNFNCDAVNDLFLFFGQVMRKPSWATCIIVDDSKDENSEYVFSCAQKINPGDRSMRTLRRCRPSKVQQRLPEEVMPLQTQKLATFSQKHIAVERYLSENNGPCYGYTTKQGGPVYLFGANAYPFEAKTNEEWNSFVLLPSVFVKDSDQGIEERQKDRKLAFEVPVDASKFEQLGSYILQSPHDGLAVAEALQNCRLVGLYFSAHWCGRK